MSYQAFSPDWRTAGSGERWPYGYRPV